LVHVVALALVLAASGASACSSAATFNGSETASCDIANNAFTDQTSFNDASSAGAVAIVNSHGGFTYFYGTSSADTATITNSPRGGTYFHDDSNAGAAVITNSSGGFTDFYDTSSAGTAAIINDNAGEIYFYDTSSAGAATITNNNGGTTYFDHTSSADNATIINRAGGDTDISLHASGPNLEIGSLSGDGDVYLGSNTLVLGGLGRNDVIGGAIQDGGLSGTVGGSLIKIGTGTLTLNGANTYTGATEVRAGSLIVGGTAADSGAALDGAATVDAGAMLGGHGTVGGDVTIASGGRLSPGNSIGTLHVGGDLSFAPGALYRVEVDPGSPAADSTVVTGTAHLTGATVHVIGVAGAYKPSQTHTILTAGTLDGTFAGVTSAYAFLTPSLSYGTDSVSLTLAPNGVPFSRFADTSNQRATATALDSLPQTSRLYGSVVTMDAAQAPAVFDALSGEIHANALSALQAGAAATRERALAPLRQHLSDPAGVDHIRPWTQVFGDWRNFNGDGNAAATHDAASGFLAGAGVALGAGWRAGAAFGYTDHRIRTHDRASTARVDSYNALAYGGKSVVLGAGRLNLMVGAGVTWDHFHTERDVSALDLDQTLNAHYDGQMAQIFTELGYALPLATHSTLEPFAGLALSTLHRGSFDESGGSAALDGQSQRDTLSTSTLGLRARTTWASGSKTGTLTAALGWRHAFGGYAPESDQSFAQGGDTFTVAGVPIARDAATLGASASIVLAPGATLALSYAGQFGGGNQADTAQLGLRSVF